MDGPVEGVRVWVSTPADVVVDEPPVVLADGPSGAAVKAALTPLSAPTTGVVGGALVAVAAAAEDGSAGMEQLLQSVSHQAAFPEKGLHAVLLTGCGRRAESQRW